MSRLAALLEGFAPSDRDAWTALVDKTLKGQPLERLATPLGDGVVAAPLYTPSPDGPRLKARRAPGDAARPWDLRVLIADASPAAANRSAIEALEGGAHSLLVAFDPAGETGLAVADADGLARALEGVLLDVAPVALDAGLMGPQAADWLATLAKGAPSAALGFNLDPLSALATSGHTPGPIESHLIAAAQTGARHHPAYPRATLFLASGRAAHEAGATPAQELGLMLSAALAYARALNRAGLSLADSLGGVALELSLDADLFVGVAKSRAARALWARLSEACGAPAPARIEARSSRRMLTRADAWTNLLRLTGATFAGAVGGADVLTLDPFTAALGDPTPIAQRQARNIQLVLMEEAGLGRVADPAGGSAFVEALSDELARAAWRQFQTIEAEGGVIAALESGSLARAIQGAAEERLAETRSRKRAIVGVSQFADPGEAAAACGVRAPEPVSPPPIRLPGPDSRCEALTPIRWSAPFEALRAEAAALTPTPRLAIVTLGAAKDYVARADFARNLVAVAGLRVETTAIETMGAATAPTVILCGSDEAYAALTPPTLERLKAAGVKALWLAGRPQALDPALADAFAGFLFMGMDIVTGLQALLQVHGDAA